MRYNLIITVSIIFIVLAVYWPLHEYGFVFYDDNGNLYKNPYLNPVSFEGVKQFWLKSYIHLYIPVTYTAWAFLTWLSPEVAGADASARFIPQIFHTANIILHLLNVLLVRGILLFLLRKRYPDKSNDSRTETAAWLGALLFALHPMMVESVAWATEMKGLLAAFFSLVAIREYLVYAERARNDAPGRRIHYMIAAASFALALLSKPTAAAAPLMALVLDTLVLGGKTKSSLKALSPWFVLLAIFAAITKYEQPDTAIGYVASLWQRFLVAGDALTFYLYKLFLPVRLGIDYGRLPEIVLGQWWIYLTALFPLLLLAVILRMKKSRPWLAAYALFAAALAPVLGFMPFLFQAVSTVADRYAYLAMAGPALFVALLIMETNSRKFIMAGLIIMLMFLAMRTAGRLPVWKNNMALFTSAITVNRNSYISYYGLGRYFLKKEALQEAERNFKKSIALYTDNAQIYNDLAEALYRQGKMEESLPYFQKSLRMLPDSAITHFNFANALVFLKRYGEAISHYRIAIVLKKNFTLAYNNLADTLKETGKLREAIYYYSKALSINPDLKLAQKNIRDAQIKLEKNDKDIP